MVRKGEDIVQDGGWRHEALRIGLGQVNQGKGMESGVYLRYALPARFRISRRHPRGPSSSSKRIEGEGRWTRVVASEADVNDLLDKRW